MGLIRFVQVAFGVRSPNSPVTVRYKTVNRVLDELVIKENNFGGYGKSGFQFIYCFTAILNSLSNTCVH